MQALEALMVRSHLGIARRGYKGGALSPFLVALVALSSSACSDDVPTPAESQKLGVERARPNLADLDDTLAAATAWTGIMPSSLSGQPIASDISIGAARFPVGTRSEYSVQLDSSGTISVRPFIEDAAGGSDQSIEGGNQKTEWKVSVRGRAIFETVATGRVAGKLVADHVEMLTATSGRSPVAHGDQSGALQLELSQPFELEMSSSGAFERIRLAKGLEPSAVEILTNLLHELSAALPNDGVHSDWQRVERETSGPVDYLYIAAPQGTDKVNVQKLRLAEQVLRTYENGVASKLATNVSVQGGRAMQLDDAGGFLAALRIDETVGFVLEGTHITMTTRGEMVRLTTGPATGDVPRPEGNNIAFGDSLRTFRDEIAPLARSDNAGFRVAVLELNALTPEEADRLERFKWINDLSKRLRRDGVPTRDVVALLEGNLEEHARTVLIDAIAKSNRPDLVPALVGLLLDEDASPEAREQVAIALLHSAEPHPDLAGALRTLATGEDRSIASTALSVLGAVVNGLAKHDPKSATEEVEWLEQKLEANEDPSMKVYLIVALGNAGMARSYPLLRPYVDQGRVAQRERAISALRKMQLDEVDPELVRLIESSDLDRIKIAAVTALATRKSPAALPTYSQLLASEDASPELKSKVMSELGAFTSDPRTRSMLRARLGDPSPAVRERAAKVLEAWFNETGAGERRTK